MIIVSIDIRKTQNKTTKIQEEKTMKNNNYLNDLKDYELEQVTGGLGGQETKVLRWHWGDDWGEGSYWDDTGATRE